MMQGGVITTPFRNRLLLGQRGHIFNICERIAKTVERMCRTMLRFCSTVLFCSFERGESNDIVCNMPKLEYENNLSQHAALACVVCT